MKKGSSTFLFKHQFFFSSFVIGVLIFSGAIFTARYSGNIAAVVAANCYIQSEIDAKIAEKASIESQVADAKKEIGLTNDDIAKNWESLASANAEIARLTPTVMSDYALELEKEKASAILGQLTDSKNLGALGAQVQGAKNAADAAKKAADTVYPQLQLQKSTVTKMFASVNAAKKTATSARGRITYNNLLSQYNAHVARYNSLNARYNTALAQYNSATSQYNTLSAQYVTASTQYKSKYNGIESTADLQKQYDDAASRYNQILSDNDAIKAKIASLNNDKVTYDAQDKVLNQKVEALTAILERRTAYAIDAAKAIDTFQAHICPAAEALAGDESLITCTDKLDNDRDGKQDCEDQDCNGTVACQVKASCGDGVCSMNAGENASNCPQDCEVGTGSAVKYFPPKGALVDVGISELTVTFPDDIDYAGGTFSIFEDGVASEVGISVSSTTSRKITLSLTDPLKPATFYSINANLDLGGGNQWAGSWSFKTVDGSGNGNGGGGVYGCTGVGADNYNPSANVDDGSCTYNGGSGQQEICGNRLDDNSNGFTDCEDPVCSSTSSCQGADCSQPSNCGLPECANTPSCTNQGNQTCSQAIDKAGLARAEAEIFINLYNSKIDQIIAKEASGSAEDLEEANNIRVSLVALRYTINSLMGKIPPITIVCPDPLKTIQDELDKSLETRWADARLREDT